VGTSPAFGTSTYFEVALHVFAFGLLIKFEHYDKEKNSLKNSLRDPMRFAFSRDDCVLAFSARSHIN